ncbi:MAG: carbohydrate kinase [Jatrophihabitantaceae bacterium]
MITSRVAVAVAVVGEGLVDVSPAAGGRPETARPGGSPLNVAVGLARLQQPVALFARFARDEHGRLLRAHATSNGVDLTHAVDAAEPSTTARVHLDTDGAAQYDFAVDGTADFAWTDEELEALPAEANIVHFGSLASWRSPGADVIDRRIAQLRTAGAVLISFDPNIRPGLQLDPLAARNAVERSIAHAHLVKASEDDVRYLYSGDEVQTVARRWLSGGVGLVIITRGPGGSSAFTDGVRVDRPSPRVDVVDTVGAGDAFTAGLLDALLRRSLGTPVTFTGALADPRRLAAVLNDAALVAALTCTRAGADPPTAKELSELRNSSET